MLKLILSLALVAVIRAADPVYVEVYYESLCPDSKAFIANQLWPTYQLVPEILTVVFVPFGFSNYTPNGDTYDFTCQHGPDECYGNKIHACALNYYPNNVDNVPFISCSMAANDTVAASEGCADTYGLNWQDIYGCANADLGGQLLEANGVVTLGLDPEMTWVPWIVLNHQFTVENEILSQTNFLKLACDTYQAGGGVLPAGCTSTLKK